MKRWIMAVCAILSLTLLANHASAQPEKGKKGPPEKGKRPPFGKKEGFGGPRFGPPGFPPPNPLLKALDANKDGTISAEEIKNASQALKKLDKNEDGELTREELRPPFGPFAGKGKGDFKRPPFGKKGKGDFKRPPFKGKKPGAGFQFDAKKFVERLKSLDENGDKKLSKDEVPERMQKGFRFFDQNEDGFIDETEMQRMAERFGQFGKGKGKGPGGKKRPDAPKKPRGEI